MTAGAYLLIAMQIVLSLLLAGCETVPPGKSLFKTAEIAVQHAIAEQLGFPVSLQIETNRNSDSWAFLAGLPLTTEQERIDYSKTPYANEVRFGFFDDGFIALVKRAPGGREGWTVVELSIGATDAPFISAGRKNTAFLSPW